MRKESLASVFAGLALVSSPVRAEDLESADCGERVPLDAAFLEGVAQDGRFVTAWLGHGDALLVAEGPGGLGNGVFVRRNGVWRGYGLSGIGGIQAVYQEPGGAVFAWAYNGRGDPPSHYTAFRVGARPGQQFCTEIEPAKELNRSFQPPYEWDWRGEYFDFSEFNLDSRGTGAVVGSASLQMAENAEPQSVPYRYETRNGGRTWSEPRRVGETPPPPRGVFVKVETADATLLEELRRQAKRD
jgi:hypothetical protein